MKAERFKRLTNDELLDPVMRKSIYETLLDYEETEKKVRVAIEEIKEIRLSIAEKIIRAICNDHTEIGNEIFKNA